MMLIELSAFFINYKISKKEEGNTPDTPNPPEYCPALYKFL